MSAVDIKWGTPPPANKGGGSNKGKGVTQLFVRQLRERPGEWAKYPRVLKVSGSTSPYRNNFPGTEWTERLMDDGVHVWARWVGES